MFQKYVNYILEVNTDDAECHLTDSSVASLYV